MYAVYSHWFYKFGRVCTSQCIGQTLIFRIFHGVVFVQTWMTLVPVFQPSSPNPRLKAGRASTVQASTWIVCFSHVAGNIWSFSESSHSATDRTISQDFHYFKLSEIPESRTAVWLNYFELDLKGGQSSRTRSRKEDRKLGHSGWFLRMTRTWCQLRSSAYAVNPKLQNHPLADLP